jgi:hypothetical protein
LGSGCERTMQVTNYGSAVLRFTRVVRSQSTLRRLLRGEIKKKTPDMTFHWNP